MVYMTIELLTGLSRKHGYAFVAAVLIIPALAPLLKTYFMAGPFIVKLCILIVLMFGRFAAYSLIFGCIRLNVVYITICSFLTSQTYSTIFRTYFDKGMVLDTVSLAAESVVLLTMLLIVRKKRLGIPIRQAMSSVPRKQYVMILVMAVLINVFMLASNNQNFNKFSKAVMIPTMIGFIAVLL